MIVHLPLLHQIQFPQNLQSLYAKLLPIATFDMMPSEYTTDLVFEFPEDQELDEDAYSEYILLDYESHDSIPNLGSIFLFTTYLVLLTCGLGLLLISRKGCLRKLIPEEKVTQLKGYVSRSIILLLIESAFEFIICGYLNLVKIEVATWED